jgi:hypothetical protein
VFFLYLFKGSKGEDPKALLREYKRAYIGMGLRTIIK